MSTQDIDESAVEAIAERFEDAWLADNETRIEDFLPEDSLLRAAALPELVGVELELRLKKNDAAKLEDYLDRFPELRNDQERLLELISWEYRLRLRQKPQLRITSYRDRFPELYERLLKFPKTDVALAPTGDKLIRLNCPNCGSAIAIAGEGDLSGRHCPDCDTPIDLDTATDLSWQPNKLPRIGRFELLYAVGKGTFGTVYKAKDKELDRIVAVKVPRSGSFSSTEDEDRFVREGRSMAQLDHPGIVKVFEVARTPESIPYIVSEYIDGVTLADSLTAESFTPTQATNIVRQIAWALNHAHKQGVVHRDLKPSNIMLQKLEEGSGSDSGSTSSSVSRSGSSWNSSNVGHSIYRARVMDFGLARREGVDATMTIEGQILGTAAYMSPEQAAGRAHQVDGRSDIYSLGVILFELLTGERPFRGSRQMLLQQTLSSEPPRLRRLNDRIPPDLDTICLKCLEKSPDSRFTSSDELAEELTRYLNGEPIQSRRISSFARGWRWCKRNKTVASLTVASVCALLVGTIVSAYFAALSNEKATDLDQALTAMKVEKVRAETSLAESLLAQGDFLVVDGRFRESKEKYKEAGTIFSRLGLSSLPLHLSIAEMFQTSPPELARYPFSSKICFSLAQEKNAVIIGHRDGTLVMIDMLTGRKLKNIAHMEPYSFDAIEVFPDGMRLATISDWGLINTVDISSGKILKSWKIQSKDSLQFLHHNIAVTPNGELLIWQAILRGTNTNKELSGLVKAWKVESTECVLTQKTKGMGLAISGDGKRCIAGNTLIDLEEMKEIRKYTMPLVKENDKSTVFRDRIRSVALSPSGELAIFGTWNGFIHCLDTKTGKDLVGTDWKPHLGLIYDLKFHPGGESFLSTSQDETVKTWHRTSEQGPSMWRAGPDYHAHSAEVFKASWLKDKIHFVTNGADNSLALWNSNPSSGLITIPNRSLEQPLFVRNLEFSKDGKLLLMTADCWSNKKRMVYLLDTQGGHILLAIDSKSIPRLSVQDNYPGGRAWFSKTNKEILVAESSTSRLVSYEICTGRIVETLPVLLDGELFSFAPNTALFATANQNAMHIWDLGSKAYVCSIDCEDPVMLSLHPSEHLVSYVDKDGILHALEIPSGQIVRNPSRFGSIKSGTRGILWDPIKAVLFGSNSFSRDLRKWTLDNKDFESLWGHQRGLRHFAISSNGKWCITTSYDDTIRFWDIEKSRTAKAMDLPNVQQVAVDTAGDQFALWSRDRGLEIIKLNWVNGFYEELNLSQTAVQRLQQNGDDVEALEALAHWYVFRRQWDSALYLFQCVNTITKDAIDSDMLLSYLMCDSDLRSEVDLVAELSESIDPYWEAAIRSESGRIAIQEHATAQDAYSQVCQLLKAADYQRAQIILPRLPDDEPLMFQAKSVLRDRIKYLENTQLKSLKQKQQEKNGKQKRDMPSVGNKVFSWTAAEEHIGELVTLQGKVVRIGDIGTIWFLNFAKDQRGAFTVVVKDDSFSKFVEHPSTMYRDKVIHVHGTITLHKGSPQIVVTDPKQITVVEPE